MNNSGDDGRTYSRIKGRGLQIYTADRSIFIGGFDVTNIGYVERLEEELSARYKVSRKGRRSSRLPRELRLPKRLVIKGRAGGRGELATINFGAGYVEISGLGNNGSAECVEFLTSMESLVSGLHMSSGLPEGEIKTTLRTEREKMFSGLLD